MTVSATATAKDAVSAPEADTGTDTASAPAGRGPKAPADPARFIFPAIVATLMSFLMSGIITGVNLGITAAFPRQWLEAWALALPVALVAILFVAPVARRLTAAIVTRIEAGRVSR